MGRYGEFQVVLYYEDVRRFILYSLAAVVAATAAKKGKSYEKVTSDSRESNMKELMHDPLFLAGNRTLPQRMQLYGKSDFSRRQNANSSCGKIRIDKGCFSVFAKCPS